MSAGPLVADSTWSWPTTNGINFYGVLITPDSACYDAINSIIGNAQKPMLRSWSEAITEITATSDLPLLGSLSVFGSWLLSTPKKDPIGVTYDAPHVFDLGTLKQWSDLSGILKLDGEGIHLNTRKTLSALARQRWNINDPVFSQELTASRVGADQRFKDIICYLRLLVQGRFIDRNGTSLSFGLNTQSLLDPSSTSSSFANLGSESPQIASDLIYALIECIGDEKFTVPMYDTTDKDTYTRYACWISEIYSQPPALLPDPDPDSSQKYQYKDSQGHTCPESDLVGALIAYAAKTTESAVKSWVGALIRGIVVGPNNTVAEEVVATAFSVAAKKLMEKITFTVLVDFFSHEEPIGHIKAQDMQCIVDRLRAAMSLKAAARHAGRMLQIVTAHQISPYGQRKGKP